MPRGGGGRRGGDSSAEPEAIHELGVRGRKTGAFLKDTGERDEHGMQPLDAIFSSPGDALTNRDESGSEDMEISSSAGPGPRTVLKNRHSFQNATSSSPTRNPSAEKAARRLDFSGKAANKAAAKTNGKPKAAAVNGVSRPLEDSASEELDDVMGASGKDAAEESMMMVDSAQPSTQKKRGSKQAKEAPPAKPKAPKAATRAPASLPLEETEPEQQEEEPEEEEELEQEEPEEEPPSARQKGRPAKQDQKSASRKRGPPRKSPREDTPEESREPSEEEEEEEEDEDAAPRKKQRTTAAKGGSSKPKASSKGKAAAPARGNIVVPVSTARKGKPKAEPKTKGRPGRKPKNASAGGDEDGDVGETSFAALQRGPPMPKSRGLVSLRKDLDDVMTQTRSGRHSYRPVQYWRGEQVVREDEEQADMFAKDQFVLPSIKEIVRVPEEEVRSRGTASRGKARSKQKKAVVEEEYEEWEVSPGTVEGEIVIWETEHEEHPPADDEPVQVTDERIAISAKAVQTSEIRDATFRFAKTLTMPFMGAGVVDLPPGGEKRPKNSRKMHMVFFVHTGKVMVTINEAQFRISAGGMWFVPRGNYYSITNDYDNPSRVFFCQACEISPSMFEASQMSIGA
ncbi:Mif2/CENP-C like domain-containing protein [Trichoderma austrokoningii]